MYHGKDCVKIFIEYIEDEVKWFYATFPQQPMTEITDVLKRESKVTEKCNIYFKEFNSENRKVRNHCNYTGLFRGTA